MANNHFGAHSIYLPFKRIGKETKDSNYVLW